MQRNETLAPLGSRPRCRDSHSAPRGEIERRQISGVGDQLVKAQKHCYAPQTQPYDARAWNRRGINAHGPPMKPPTAPQLAATVGAAAAITTVLIVSRLKKRFQRNTCGALRVALGEWRARPGARLCATWFSSRLSAGAETGAFGMLS